MVTFFVVSDNSVCSDPIVIIGYYSASAVNVNSPCSDNVVTTGYYSASAVSENSACSDNIVTTINYIIPHLQLVKIVLVLIT